MDTHPGSRSRTTAPAHVTLFASILLRRPFDALDPEDASIVGWAAAEAARWHADGRADVAEDVLAYRFIYRALRQQANEAEPVELAQRGPRWERVLRAACNLRHRQRAMLALYYCAGLEPVEAGKVVHASEAQARAVIESAVSGVAKLLGEPVDVRRSLRMASARLMARATDPAPAPEGVSGPTAAVEPSADAGHVMEVSDPARASNPAADGTTPTPSREGARSVMRNWISTAFEEPIWPPIAEPLSIPRASPVEMLTADLGVRREDARRDVVVPLPRRPEQRAPEPVRPVAARGDRRPWFAAVAAALVLAVLAPGLAVEDGSLAPPPLERPRVEQAVDAGTLATDPGAFGKIVARVRTGDSLWALAVELLGDGGRWRDIWRRNRGRVMAAGERFTDPDLIKPGWRLIMPPGIVA